MYAKYLDRSSVVIDGVFWKVIERRGGGWYKVRRRVSLFKRETRIVRINDDMF